MSGRLQVVIFVRKPATTESELTRLDMGLAQAHGGSALAKVLSIYGWFVVVLALEPHQGSWTESGCHRNSRDGSWMRCWLLGAGAACSKRHWECLGGQQGIEHLHDVTIGKGITASLDHDQTKETTTRLLQGDFLSRDNSSVGAVASSSRYWDHRGSQLKQQ
ncbi:hypothetical protein NL676_025812 [Syzygium grande]|nr:hypothetical protein NL676_025812 [Syzygium grande]